MQMCVLSYSHSLFGIAGTIKYPLSSQDSADSKWQISKMTEIVAESGEVTSTKNCLEVAHISLYRNYFFRNIQSAQSTFGKIFKKTILILET